MRLRAALITGALLAATPAPALATDIQVTTTADSLAADSFCSLREAITAARADSPFGGCTPGSGTDRVLVGPGHFTLTRNGNADDNNASGDLDVYNLGMTVNHVTIVGAGAGTTIIDASGLDTNAPDRVFDIGPGADVRIEGLTITGGQAPNGAAGTDKTGLPGFPGETVDGGSGSPGAAGGGIINHGTLALDNVSVSANHAGSGGKGGFGVGGDGAAADNAGGGAGGIGGSGGDGGGIENLGTLTVSDSTIVNNGAGNGGDGGLGAGGTGGALGNNAGFGGLGQGLPGGNAGWGGGIANAGALTAERSLIAGNQAGRGGDGGAGTGGDGGHTSVNNGKPGDGLGAPGGQGGWGGGIAELDVFPFPSTTISSSAIVGNGSGAGALGGDAQRGASTATESAGGGGDAGPGGGLLFMDGQTGSVTNTTLAQNGAGFGGSPGFALTGGQAGGFGKDGDGFALASRNQGLTLLHVTIAGAFPPGIPVLATQGRGILAVLLGKATLTNSIVVGNCFVNVTTTLIDGGHNVRFGGTGCPGLGGDPKLGVLGNNGGPTPTVPLGPGSAAIDSVPASGAGCLPTDQRGVARPQFAACDSGAFELTPSPPGPGGRDVTPPAVGGVTARPPTFAVGPGATPPVLRIAAKAVPRGTTIGFTLSEPARVTIAFARRAAGIKVKARKGGRARCVAPTTGNRRLLLAQIKRNLGKGATGRRISQALAKARCTRFVASGQLARSALLGADVVKFSGRVGSRALRVGRYRVRVIGTDAAGNVSKPADGAFRIVAGAKKKR